MQSNGSRLFLAVLLAVVGGAAVARAEETAPRKQESSKPVKARPWFVGLGAGPGYAMISHPQIAAGGAAVPVFTLHGGYTFGDHLSLGLEFASSETSIGRDTAQETFQLGHKPQSIWEVRCYACDPRPPGSEVVFTSLVFSTVGARVEYAPFSRDGLFFGGMAGMAFMVGLEDRAGFGFSGRVGYRLPATTVLTLSIEAGMAGQLYGDTTMFMPFGIAVLRPYFESGVRPSAARRPKPPR